MMDAIKTDRLTKHYRSGVGISDVTLAVQRGEVFGFLGPNGAGKTTTIRTLLNFLHPTSGSATILGFDSQRENIEILKRVGHLPGDFNFEPRLTGKQLISYFARLRGVEDLSAAYQLAERLNIKLEARLTELSRGNRRKIGLIQALFHKPQLVFLDEPTSGLDPLIQEEFLLLVKELTGSGCTVFISSHNLTEVERICDRVGIVRQGKLISIETVKGLTEKALRHVRISFGGPFDAEAFRNLVAVKDLKVEIDRLSLTTTAADIDHVIKAAANFQVQDIEIEHPSLEETFLTFYS